MKRTYRTEPPIGLTDEEPDVTFAEKFVFVYLTQHPPGGVDVEESHDDTGVLPLQIPHGVSGVRQEALAGHNLDLGVLAAHLQVLHRLYRQSTHKRKDSQIDANDD